MNQMATFRAVVYITLRSAAVLAPPVRRVCRVVPRNEHWHETKPEKHTRNHIMRHTRRRTLLTGGARTAVDLNVLGFLAYNMASW